MYIIKASYDRNGTICDTSNAESLGGYYGVEFDDEDDANDAVADLESYPFTPTITYTVEDIGITEAEVARKSGGEWWAILVRQQTPAEFMRCSESEWPTQAAVNYLRAIGESLPVSYATVEAVLALAGKLAEVIEAQDMLRTCPECGDTPHRWRSSPEAGPGWRCSECGEAQWLNASGVHVGFIKASPGAAVATDDAREALAGKLAEVITAQLSQWDALVADAKQVDAPTSDVWIVFASDNDGGCLGWLERNGVAVNICEGGHRRRLPASARTVAAALAGPSTATLHAMRSAGARAGDWDRVALCNSALCGETWALDECATLIEAAKA